MDGPASRIRLVLDAASKRLLGAVEPTPEDRAAYDAHAREVIDRFVQALGFATGVIAIVTWPSDALVLAGHPRVIAAFARFRAVTAGLALASIAAVSRFPRLVPSPRAVFFPVATVILLVTAHALGSIADVSGHFFYVIYAIPLSTIFLMMRWPSRLLGNAVLATVFVAVFAWADPRVGPRRFFLSDVTFLAASVAMATIGGHLMQLVHRANFFHRRALDRRAAALLEQDARKNEFVTTLSHELRTPLSAVIGYCELLQEDFERSELADLGADLRRIRAAGLHLMVLLNDVIDRSKLEGGDLQIAAEPFQLEPLLREVVEALQPLAERNDNRLELRTVGELGTVSNDPTRLRQALFNLLSNACRYTTGGHVVLEAERLERSGEEWIAFRVRDTGVGMSDEQVQGLFQEFAQAGSSMAHRTGGSGLGLVITRRIAERMSGEIQVASAPGKGSEFELRVPVSVQVAPGEAARVPEARASVPPPRERSGGAGLGPAWLPPWAHRKWSELEELLGFLFFRTGAPTPRAEDVEGFRGYARELSVRLFFVAVAVCVAGVLVTWPTDRWFLEGDAHALEGFARWRIGLVAIMVGGLAALALSPLARRHGYAVMTCAAVLGYAFLGYVLGEIGGLDLPFFYAAYVTPFVLVVFVVDWRVRLALTAAAIVALLAGYFGGHPEHLAHPFAVSIVILLVSSGAMSLLAGHAVFLLVRDNFLHRVDLAQRAVQLEALDRMRSSFVASVSHELRTPLSSIIGYAELVADEAAERGRGDVVPDLDRIRDAGRHLLELINAVLDFSKLAIGRMKLFPEEADAAELVRRWGEAAAGLASRSGYVVEVRAEPELGVLRNDVARLEQVLQLLLGNAAKFTERGSIVLEARRASEDGRDWLWFQVRDTGIGIAPDQQARLFEPFSQLDSSQARRYGGLGLGLAIAQSLAALMGGTISVRSALGQGSTFTLRVPADVG